LAVRVARVRKSVDHSPKQTSLISVIGLEELLRASAVISGATREPFYVFSITALLYLCMTGAASYGLRRMRIHSNRGEA
jgi:ABC-type arginine transport system permease subunit